MRLYAVQSADPGDVAVAEGAARDARAAAMARRRQLSQGKQALNGGGANAPALVVHRGGAG